MGFLANCYQEHCRNDIWPKVHRPTLIPKRKATSEKLRFFWGRVYIVTCHLPRAPSYGGVRTWVEGSQMRGDRALVGASNLLGYKEYIQQDFKYCHLTQHLRSSSLRSSQLKITAISLQVTAALIPLCHRKRSRPHLAVTQSVIRAHPAPDTHTLTTNPCRKLRGGGWVATILFSNFLSVRWSHTVTLTMEGQVGYCQQGAKYFWQLSKGHR